MADSSQFDVLWLDNLTLGYDVQTKELSDRPRIVSGNDTIISSRGTIDSRPGLSVPDNLAAATSIYRIDRLFEYRINHQGEQRTYLLASMWDGTYWTFYFNLPGDTSINNWDQGWHNHTTFLNANTLGPHVSLFPHEFLVARDLAFVRAVPDPAVSLIGTFVFDGWPSFSSDTPVWSQWGIPVPSTNAIVNMTGAAASGSTYTTLHGWKYCYAVVNYLGHVSCRGPLIDVYAQQTTGAITTVVPRYFVLDRPTDFMTIGGTGISDTLYIYRTTDGGGNFCKVGTLATGAGVAPFLFEDENSGVLTFPSPLTDFELDLRDIAPDRTINHPPPTVSWGKTPFVDDVEHSSTMAYFARRIFYAIGNTIWFSGQEEIYNGIPEMCFPNAYGLGGNKWIVDENIVAFKAVSDVCYAFGVNSLYFIRGEDRANLRIAGPLKNFGMSPDHPWAVTALRDVVFYMTNNYDIAAILPGEQPRVISEPLGSEFRDLVTSSADKKVEIVPMVKHGYEWLIVAVHDHNNSYLSRQYVYDLKRGIWFTPWTMPITAITVAHIPEPEVVVAIPGANPFVGVYKVAVIDFDAVDDSGGYTFTPSFATNLVSNPYGNHLNALRAPGHNPIVSYALAERTKFSPDSEPTVQYRLDEFSGAWTSVSPSTTPPYRTQSTSHGDNWYPIQKVCRRVQVQVTGTAGRKLSIQNLGFVFMPELGA
jgi:hypothetical protein